MPAPGSTRWHRIRAAFRPLGVHWERLPAQSTNACWKGTGPSGNWFLKWYRNPEPGMHPEAEIARFLHAKGFTGIPEFGGALERITASGERETVAIVQRWEPGRTAWEILLEQLALHRAPCDLADQWGRRLGELHRVLASGPPGSGFETVESTDYPRICATRIHTLENIFREKLQSPAPPHAEPQLWETLRTRWCVPSASRGPKGNDPLSEQPPTRLSRIHGDFHLGQLIQTADLRWLFVDFEGEPLRSLAERRHPDSPLRDVAGMWRSFSYAAAVAGASAEMESALQETFLKSWLGTYALLDGNWRPLLDALIREKNIYEALYEIQYRPEWLHIPARALSP
jgi:predicted trehalose synthase